jgi:DNA polymerase-3 subunit epsilon
MNIIELERPIVFIDLETTGIDHDSRIVELAVCKLSPNMAREYKCMKINPEMPIPKEASLVHGIYDKDVADSPTFGKVASSILLYLNNCDIGGFESNRFDVRILYKEFARVGLTWEYEKSSLIDAGVIFKRANPRTLAAAHKHYLGSDLNYAHSALADVTATVDVFLKQLEHHPELPKTIRELHYYSNYDLPMLDIDGFFGLDASGDYIFNKGKHRNEKAKDNRHYLQWMYLEGNFSLSTKRIAAEILGIQNH